MSGNFRCCHHTQCLVSSVEHTVNERTDFMLDPFFFLAQSFAWSSCSEWSIGLRVPFVVDICSVTFEQLDLLLRQVSEGMDGTADWPPPQEKECMAVATLNLLRLQVVILCWFPVPL